MGSPPPIQLATLGMWDTMLLMVLALVVFGPRRLPMIGRQLGKLMYEFRKASNDFKFQMEEELRNAEEADRRQKEEEERKRAIAAAPPQPQLEQTAAQTAEPATAAPESTAPAPAADVSPYPRESSYPDFAAEAPQAEETNRQNAEATHSEEAASPSTEITSELPAEPVAPPAAETDTSLPAEPTVPRIQPPSTGETVVADRPGQQPQPNEPFAPPLRDPGKATESVTPEVERSEPAAHHG
ncbi:MAG: twin-arginine translocase TatA/TatE family subunit [Terracidiphilus sp.]|jgi:sec-independent protein translocase protein TatB